MIVQAVRLTLTAQDMNGLNRLAHPAALVVCPMNYSKVSMFFLEPFFYTGSVVGIHQPFPTLFQLCIKLLSIPNTILHFFKLKIEELVKYLKHHKLSLMGKKKDKVMRILTHIQLSQEDNADNRIADDHDDATTPDNDDVAVTDDDNDCSDDDEVVTLVESDDEVDLPDLQGSRITRSGRQPIPSSRYQSSDRIAL